MANTDPSNRRDLGEAAEITARAYLEQQGLKIILTNFRCRVGELDIVAMDGKLLAVIEVRRRSATSFARAADSLSVGKQRRIIRATRFLFLTKPVLRRFPMRFDVLSLDEAADGAVRVEWIRAAFDAPT